MADRDDAEADRSGRGDDGEVLEGVSLDLTVVRRRLTEERPHTLSSLADESGIDADDVERLLRAAGRFREDDAHPDRDLEWLAKLEPMLAWVPVDFVVRNARLRSRALWALAIADLRSVEQAPMVREAVESGIDPTELAELVADASEQLLPILADLMGDDYLNQVLLLLDSDVVEQAASDLGGEVTLAVGFIDLVGFTKLSAAVDPDGMHTVLDAFEGLVNRAADQVGDVLPTKTIGDALMLVSAEPDRLARVLHLAVTDEVTPGLEDVARRAGMAFGEVRVRDGDYVGTVVNTAARLTDLAYPGSLVITHDAWDAIPDEGWDTSLLPPKHLKGLGRRRPLRLRTSS